MLVNILLYVYVINYKENRSCTQFFTNLSFYVENLLLKKLSHFSFFYFYFSDFPYLSILMSSVSLETNKI